MTPGAVTTTNTDEVCAISPHTSAPPIPVATQAAVAAETEDGDALPLLHNLDREHEIDADCDARKQRGRRMKQFTRDEAGEQTN